MLAFELTRFNKKYDGRGEEDPTYFKKITYNPIEVFNFLENELIKDTTVSLLVWDKDRFVASFAYGV